MELLEWREEYCTGMRGVDFEHEKLIGKINAVYALIDDKASKQQVIDCLGDIYGDISAHFALEEQLMRKNEYDQYAQHKADHERLLDQIGDITAEVEITAKLDEARFKQRMANWFQVHFKTHDSRLHGLTDKITRAPVKAWTLSKITSLVRNRFSNKRD